MLCRYGAVGLHFVRFKTHADRDSSRTDRARPSVSSVTPAPGQTPPGPKTCGSGASGEYVEYALTGSDERPLCGIWWNVSAGDAGFCMEALCKEALDLWLRHS
ncbi:hypothetical protein [Dactylosporangium sp. NPDC005555]|uniref:hypothetical protein n=1 Tax=Dactylosporangium sp. NPDC005555 TaxID=3154889 RepID=UPI00339FE61A